MTAEKNHKAHTFYILQKLSSTTVKFIGYDSFVSNDLLHIIWALGYTDRKKL
jgi:hypothetical protein